MARVLSVLFAAVLGAWILAGSSATASASYRRHDCCGGGVSSSYAFKTKQVARHITRYHDISRTRYVYNTHRTVHVTRVRPVVYVHNVTRVHHHTVVLLRHVHERAVQYLPPRRVVYNSVVNTYDCGCARRRYHY